MMYRELRAGWLRSVGENRSPLETFPEPASLGQTRHESREQRAFQVGDEEITIAAKPEMYVPAFSFSSSLKEKASSVRVDEPEGSE